MAPLIDLDSVEGQRLLREVKDGAGMYQPLLHAIFGKQTGSCNCGIQTAALLLSAGHAGKRHGAVHPGETVTVSMSDLPYTQDNLFTFPATQRVVESEEKLLALDGLTLDQVFGILNGFDHASVTCTLGSESSTERFRQEAMAVLDQSNSSTVVAVNYCMGALGQGRALGHHSPLAAYHADTDMFLVMDTWHKTKECWAKSDDLFNAINTVDSESGKSRGYFIVRF